MRYKHIFIVLLILLLAGLFYWFQVRPARIRVMCNKYVDERVDDPGDITLLEGNNLYRRCMVSHGLKPEDIVKIN